MSLTPQEIAAMRAHALQQGIGVKHVIEVQEYQKYQEYDKVPLWRKPGRWVPPILFLVWLGMTFMYPTMVLWFGIFVPIAFIGHHFGMGKSKPRNSYAVGQPQMQAGTSSTDYYSHWHPGMPPVAPGASSPHNPTDSGTVFWHPSNP